jgi:hypothetical protein
MGKQEMGSQASQVSGAAYGASKEAVAIVVVDEQTRSMFVCTPTCSAAWKQVLQQGAI